MTAYILAEIASAHYGKEDELYDLIFAAHKAKADGVKFQVWRRSEIKGHANYANLKKFEMSRKIWIEAAEIARSLGLEVWCEVYGAKSLALAVEMKYIHLKANRKLLKDEAFAKIIGAEECNELEFDVSWWRFNKTIFALPENIAVGEQSYPSSEKQGRKEIEICKQLVEYGYNVLYADHQTYQNDSTFILPLAAHQAGVKVIEKHICINRSILSEYSSDFISALEPGEFQEFVDFLKTDTKVRYLL